MARNRIEQTHHSIIPFTRYPKVRNGEAIELEVIRLEERNGSDLQPKPSCGFLTLFSAKAAS